MTNIIRSNNMKCQECKTKERYSEAIMYSFCQQCPNRPAPESSILTSSVDSRKLAELYRK